ncbi:MAG TPA: hypothetical protein VFU06_08175 [Longimicrobiales bacterium]|nr:hypothetical protein [Longimicrobiales bacterium]
MASPLTALRQAIEQRFPDALPLHHAATPSSVPTGIGAVDALLPGSGLPRGRLTSWAPGGGSSAVLRSTCSAVIARGERAAWIDGAHTVTADGWTRGPLLLRPNGEVEALACAEELLQSGGFGLVVVTGLGRHGARCSVRLSRAAKAGGSGLVLVGDAAEVAALRVGCRIEEGGLRWRRDPFGGPGELVSVRLRLEARALGWSGATSFDLPVWTHAPRSGVDDLLVDRRGVTDRRTAWRRAYAKRMAELAARRRAAMDASTTARPAHDEQSNLNREGDVQRRVREA